MQIDKPQVHVVFQVEDNEEIVVETNMPIVRVTQILEEVYKYINVKHLRTIHEEDEEFDEVHEEQDFIFAEKVSTH